MITVGFCITTVLLTLLFQGIFYLCKFLLTFIIPENTIYTATTSLFGEELLIWSIVLHLITIFIMLLLNIKVEISKYYFKFKVRCIDLELS